MSDDENVIRLADHRDEPPPPSSEDDYIGNAPVKRSRRAAPLTKTDATNAIRVINGRLHETATAGEDALTRSAIPIYQRGRSLVRPIRSEVPASRGRTTLAAGLVNMSLPALVDRLCQCSKWTKYDGRAKDWVAINAPVDVAATILSRVGDWTFPPIAGVITTPTLRPDGTLLTAPGYDSVTRLYHVVDESLTLDIPARPTREDALNALADLQYLLKNFPVVTEVDHAVALSALISPVIRGAIGVMPMHAFRASTAGTGKTYLVDVASAIATGRPCPVATVAKSEEETEKRLAGLLLAAFPIICLDNVNGELGGDLLCQAIERPLVQIRPLGTSDIIEIESRASIFATGNALRIRGDMTRRALICNLDAGVERPELRTFDFDPVETVLADRAKYVSAVLKIVLAHATAGFPGDTKPLGSFSEWSKWVRGALGWLGCSDSTDSMEDAREDDPELSELRDMVTSWREDVGITASYTSNEIAVLIEQKEDHSDYGEYERYTHPLLRETVIRLFGVRGAVDTRKLGIMMRMREGRIVAGHKFRRYGTAKGGLIKWQLVSV